MKIEPARIIYSIRWDIGEGKTQTARVFGLGSVEAGRRICGELATYCGCPDLAQARHTSFPDIRDTHRAWILRSR